MLISLYFHLFLKSMHFQWEWCCPKRGRNYFLGGQNILTLFTYKTQIYLQHNRYIV